MAAELTISTAFKFDKPPNTAIEWASDIQTISVSGKYLQSATQTIATANTSLNIGDMPIASVGWIVIENLDTVNYLQIGDDSGNFLLRMNAGERMVFRLDAALSAAPVLKANTAACDIQYILVAK